MAPASLSHSELLRRCAESGDSAAWEEFIGRFHGLISRVVLRAARQWGCTSPQLVDDLIQETYLKICRDRLRVLKNFESRHPDAVFGYLGVITSNVVSDHFRKLHADKRGEGQEGEPIGPLGPAIAATDTAGPEGIEKGVLLSQIDEVLVSNTPGSQGERDRLIFQLYYRQGLTAREIASLPEMKLTTKGVESTIQRLTSLIRDELDEDRNRTTPR